MKNLLMTFLFIYSFKVFAQANFEKGYFINNNDEKTECLIKNVDWINNPTSFDYKLDESSKSQTNDITEVKAFEIYNTIKFIRAKVNVDLSVTNVNYLSKKRQPDLVEQELFLKEIVSGEASLYEYNHNLTHKFFYNTSQKNIEPLIYSEYKIDGDKIGKNLSYQQELFINLVCESISLNQIKKVKYNDKDLVNLFVKYNSCKNPEQQVVVSKTKDNNFNFTLRPRVNFINLKNDYYDKKANASIGFEIEYVFPMNHKKWSVFIDPNYSYVGYNKHERRGDVDIYLKYHTIELPVGVRYSLALNDKSKIYINAVCIFDINLDSSIKIERKIIRYTSSRDLKRDPGFAFGLGYKFKDTYSIEARTTTKLDHGLGYYNITSIILGYRIF